MKTSEGDLLPLNSLGLPNRAPEPSFADFFLCGDERANTTFGLCALHTLFVREHNRLAEKIASTMPELGDEEVFQRARRIIVAQIQVIAYNEFLPALLGQHFSNSSVRYDVEVDATISEVFAGVGFRFGYSVLSDQFALLYENGTIERVPQKNSFFNVDIIKRFGTDPIFRGLASRMMEEIGTRIVDDIRNRTIRFGVEIDLLAYDIQSGRDFGIPDFNTVREDMGFPRVSRWCEITSNHSVQRRLQSVYANIDCLDPIIGGLAEDHLPGACLGPLLTSIVVNQFERLRKGDRFWYENDHLLLAHEIIELRGMTLSSLIRRNTGIVNIQDNVFVAAAEPLVSCSRSGLSSQSG